MKLNIQFFANDFHISRSNLFRFIILFLAVYEFNK